jgi:hypothetical protein
VGSIDIRCVPHFLSRLMDFRRTTAFAVLVIAGAVVSNLGRSAEGEAVSYVTQFGIIAVAIAVVACVENRPRKDK